MKKINNSRRQFVNNGIKTAGLLSIMPGSLLPGYTAMRANTKKHVKRSNESLRILILGGTSFLGPHQIAYALDRGHKITTFTRGKTKPTIYTDRFNQIEQLIGDREDNLEALKGREWDAVIDNSGRRVHWTTATAELLKDNVGFYAYTSTVSVYYPYFESNAKEGDRVVLKMPETFDDDDEKQNFEYGVMKANSELEARKYFGDDRTIIVRPTFMTGPADRTDRFMYWPTQLAKGGDIIVPGRTTDPVQFIDVRDIAEFMVRLIENQTAGTFNGVGPASTMTVPAFVYGAHAAFGTKVNYHHLNNYDFLESNTFTFQAPWVKDMKKYHGISRVNNEHSIANGLSFRPLAQTVRDTHDWWYSDAVSEDRRLAFASNENELHNRQRELIEKWGRR